MPTDTTDTPTRRSINTRGRTLRQFAAHGVLVNATFDVGVGMLTLVRGVALAALLSKADFGLWGILLVSLGALAQLKLIGISDKFVQQDEDDQELAFQRAFTLELAVSVLTTALLLAATPLVCVVYGNWHLLAPGMVLATLLLAYAFQSPQWIFYREMDFVTQRLQTVVEPVVGLVVAVALALAGAGYWALVIGVLTGAWAGAAVAIRMSPYRLAISLDWATAKVYGRFSGPILIGTVGNVLMVNGTVLVCDRHLGLGAVGAVALATTILSFTTRVDDTVAATIYPGICRIVDKVDLLRESFTKTNRLAMLWAIPFGVGLTLFAPEVIHLVLGDKWRIAQTLLEITGLVAAVNHIGFNWDDYYRAKGETRPLAAASMLGAAVTLCAGIPLMLAYGLSGLAWGIAASTAAVLVLRAFYIHELFNGFTLLAHGWRALAPAIPAAGLVVLSRLVIPHSVDVGPAVAEFAIYVVAILAGSWFWERALIREALTLLSGKVA